MLKIETIKEENTEEYKHFKLLSDSNLKNLTKVELIDYIRIKQFE